MIHEVYQSEIKKLEIEKKQLKQRSNLFLFGKLLFFAFASLCGYLAFTTSSDGYITITLLGFGIYVVLYIADTACQKQIDLLRRKQVVCQKELACLNGEFTAFDAGEHYLDYRHEYAFDLDVFGKDSLYNRINRTVTQRGSDRLASKLNALHLDKEEILDNQAAIAELASLHDWRIKFMSSLLVKDQLDGLSKINSNGSRLPWFVASSTSYIWVAITLILFLLAVIGWVSWNVFGGVFVLNLFVSALFGKLLRKTNSNIERLHKECMGYLEVLKDIQQVEFKSEKLLRLQRELFGVEWNSMNAFRQLSKILNLFDQRGNVIVYVLLNGCVLFDLVLIKSFVRWSNRYLPSMERWLDSIAEVDALVSFGTYAFNHPENTYAELLDNHSEWILKATGIYHPFLSQKKAVPNDFMLQKNHVSIVTGANMAGKSTFLRTIGVNYLLAVNGVPVCASSFRCALVALFSSMRTTDNLSKDISYFNAELLRLEQLMEYVKSRPFTLIILDEILKGTNSKDKLEGSKIFLQTLSKYPVSALIATHDLELANLEKEDSDTYRNYRFEIELSDEITYSYKIEEGIAQNLNASYLLKNMLAKLDEV